MAQLSRPYQIALGALALLALVWFFALRRPGGESSSSSAPSAPSAASASPSSSGGSSAAGTSSVYHGSAPGVEGLTKDIAKAHQAVTESQRDAQALQRKSAQASGEAATGGAAASAATGAATHSSASTSATASRAGKSVHAAATASGAEAAPRAAALESDLGRGKVGVVLFWNPKAYDDRHVHEQLESLSHGNRRIALLTANSNEVTAFGQFTRTVQVLGTPTVLIVNHQGQVTTLTGLTDTFSVGQAIGDATKGAGRVQAPTFTSWTPTSSRARFIDEANHVCKQATGPTVREIGALQTPKARLAAYVSAVAVIFHKVEGLHVPTQDRPFIHHQFSLFLAALRNESRPHDRKQLRQLFLEGEAVGDEVHNGLLSYGLSSCV
jgi:hypothetical protein